MIASVLTTSARGMAVPQRMAANRRDLLSAGGSLAAVSVVPGAASAKSRDDASYPVRKKDEEWRRELSRTQYAILRQGGTERPNSSILVSEKRSGKFLCAGCDAELFESGDKFDSGTGWPSFAAATSNVEVENVAMGGFTGAELRCSKCGGHLGDRFGDGAFFPGTKAAKTGQRYCIDGAALVFYPSDGSESVRGDIFKPAFNKDPSWLSPPKINAI